MFLMVGIIPVLLIILVALHLYVKSHSVRLMMIIGALVGCVMTGTMHFMLIGVLLLCVELILIKVMER